MKGAIIIFAAVFISACAGGVTRDAVLSRTLAGLGAADEAFVAYDAKVQAEIVDAAQSESDGKIALFAYRARRDKVTGAFIVAYTAVASASVDITDASLAELLHATAAAIAALKELR